MATPKGRRKRRKEDERKSEEVINAQFFTRWRDFEEAVAGEAAALEERCGSARAVPFFRGHASTDFDLRPSLLRPHGDRWFTPEDEQSFFFYEFVSRAGSVIPAGFDSWDILFLMRHYRTRAGRDRRAGTQPLTLTAEARSAADRYVQLAGINDYSLYPDLDGLARLLNRRIQPQSRRGWDD